jgi:hypothetical protein
MSKRVQRYVCGECDRAYVTKSGADECEAYHAETAAAEARERAWEKIADGSWRFTMEQIEQIAALVKSWGDRIP